MQKVLAIIGALVVLFVCGCVGLVVMTGGLAALGSTSSTSGSTTTGSRSVQPTAAPAAVGQSVRAGDWEVTVTGVERMKTLTWSAVGNRTDAKGEWLIVSLTLVNRGNRNFAMNTFDWELRDSGGVTYATSSEGGTYMYPEFRKVNRMGDQVPPGVPYPTMLIFDVAPGASGLQLILKATGTRFSLG
ncbi:MAG: DUF4352 domain-containing protein [Dehalococcoidia bacterium]